MALTIPTRRAPGGASGPGGRTGTSWGESGGRVVASRFAGDSQMTRNAVFVWVVVDREERGRGHGRALAAAVEERAALFDAAVVTTNVRDDDSA